VDLFFYYFNRKIVKKQRNMNLNRIHSLLTSLFTWYYSLVTDRSSHVNDENSSPTSIKEDVGHPSKASCGQKR
jgi:hypothetical protein